MGEAGGQRDRQEERGGGEEENAGVQRTGCTGEATPSPIFQGLPARPTVQTGKRGAACQLPRVGGRERRRRGEDRLDTGKVKAAGTRLRLVGLGFLVRTLDVIPKSGLIGRS